MRLLILFWKILEFWTFGLLEIWIFEKLEFRKFKNFEDDYFWKFGILKFRIFENLEFWNLIIWQISNFEMEFYLEKLKWWIFMYYFNFSWMFNLLKFVKFVIKFDLFEFVSLRVLNFFPSEFSAVICNNMQQNPLLWLQKWFLFCWEITLEKIRQIY